LLKKDTIREIYDELKEKRADIQNLTSYTDPIPTENFTAKVQFPERTAYHNVYLTIFPNNDDTQQRTINKRKGGLGQKSKKAKKQKNKLFIIKKE